MGLAYWMEEVLVQCAKAEQDFSSGPVHDLRTALRRCRSMADGIRVFDRDPAWKKMRRAAKQFFSSLGELRDTHIMQEWVEKLSPEGDPAGNVLRNFLSIRERESKRSAAAALEQFDRVQWRAWASKLPARAARIPVDSPIFAHLALERWLDAHNLHSRALRNRTNVAFHQLRIGLKRFRYTLENFLPTFHQAFGGDLKHLQDALGEIHDLDVLWETAVRIKAFADGEERTEWRNRIARERQERLNTYRSKMVGRDSLWSRWRAALPQSSELRSLGLERMRIWASFLNPDIAHPKLTARLALQVYDALPIEGIVPRSKGDSCRWILHAAALMHDVGRSKGNSGHHKISSRLVRKSTTPLGWSTGELRLVALAVRYHRGALPSRGQRLFAALSPSAQRLVQFLAGLLRLACACDWEHDGKISHVSVESLTPVITLRAKGYSESTALAEHIAAARHLLELTYGRPILVLAAGEKSRSQAA